MKVIIIIFPCIALLGIIILGFVIFTYITGRYLNWPSSVGPPDEEAQNGTEQRADHDNANEPRMPASS